MLTTAIEAVQKEITKRGGQLVVKNPPRSISEREETEFTEMLETMGNDGDDDDEEDEEEEEEEEDGDEKKTTTQKAPPHSTTQKKKDDKEEEEEEDGAEGKLRRIPEPPTAKK